jgi:hypothetical protein
MSKVEKNVQKSVTNVRESEKKCAGNVKNCRKFFTPLRELFEANNSRSFEFLVHSS